MKVFVAESREKGNMSSTDYNWCDENELLMFGQFQKENSSEVSMCGILSRKYTTHILVKDTYMKDILEDIDISKEYYKELIVDSVEKSMNCVVDGAGYYNVGVDFKMSFNINETVDELLEKASHFKDGQKVKCFGKILTLIEN